MLLHCPLFTGGRHDILGSLVSSDQGSSTYIILTLFSNDVDWLEAVARFLAYF